MKGFIARNQQLLAIAASAAVLVIVASALTGIILAGRKTTAIAAKPTPSATFAPGPSFGPTDIPSPSGPGNPSPGATPSSAAAGAASSSSSGAAGAGGRPTTTPISFGNGGAPCPVGLANCTPPPRATAAPEGSVATPRVDWSTPTTGANPNTSPASDAVALAPDGSTVWFSVPNASAVTSASDTSASVPHTLANGGYPRGLTLDSAGRLWVVDAVKNAVYRFDPSALTGATITPSGTYTFDSAAVPAYQPGQPTPGIVVDAQGDVWFALPQRTSFGPSLGHIPHTQVAATGTSAADQCKLRYDASHSTAGLPFSMLASGGKLYIGTLPETSGSPYAGLLVYTPPGTEHCSDSAPGTWQQISTQAPASCSQTSGIQSVAQGFDGKIWFATSAGVGQLVGATAAITVCNSSSGTAVGGNHLGLVAAPDPAQGPGHSAMWTTFQENGTMPAGIARILSTSGNPFSTAGATPTEDLRGVVADAGGHLWIADGSQNKIVEAKISKAS